MRLTPDILAAAYEYLRVCPPFKRWNLPHADDVEFHVTRQAEIRGWHRLVNGQHAIGVSSKCVGRSDSLMATMAHEIIHMHGDRKGIRSAHGAWFKRQAAMACRQHGFDPLLF